MFVLELLGFSLLINVGMVTANPGLCPFYPRVSSRDPTCYKLSNCSVDSDCKDNLKCCENPCGITLCFDIDPDPLVKIEKCPIVHHSSGCTRKRTTFCFINDCNRCCNHETKCNPAPKLLKKAKECHPEICAKHKCPQQGSVCFVDKATSKPMCRCIPSCNNNERFVCASDGKKIRTFRNNCLMDKEACDKEKTFTKKYEGRCLPSRKKVEPVQKPTVRDQIQYPSIGSSITVNCIGDSKVVHLVWIQKRADGKEVELSDNLQIEQGIYKLKEKTRKVLALYISSIGPASYGVYSCKQEIDNVILETELHIRPTEEVLFDRTWCNQSRDNGTCNGNFTNYYYDKFSKRCTPFRYQGCKGNNNNFQTLNECNVKCGGMMPSRNTPITLLTSDKKCGDKICRFHETCIKKSRKYVNATCVCKQECALNPKPICASNGQTFISLCTMKVEACRWRKNLTALYSGKCGPYQPNKAYVTRLSTTTRKPLSLCELKRCPPYAKCFVNPFTRIPLCYCPETCPFSPNIICASNRKHYLNECFMKNRSCKEKRKLTVLKKGLCLFNNLAT